MFNLTPKLSAHPTFSENYDGKPMTPTYSAIPEQYLDDDEVELIIGENYDFDLFGSDCIGGYAYVGSIKDIDCIQKQVESLIKELVNKNKYKQQLYIRWDLADEDKSLLLFYNDYYYDNMPCQENVMCLNYGAWTDDDTLDMVIVNTEYFSDDWLIGKEKFDMENPSHYKMYNKAVNIIEQVGNCKEKMEQYKKELEDF